MERDNASGRAFGHELTIGFVARAALVVIVLWGLVNLLWLGRDVLFVAFFSVLVASFLSIFVDWLDGWGLPRGLAAPIVLLLFLALLGGLFWIAWPTIQEQAGVIRRQVPEAIAQVESWVRNQYQAVTGELGRPNATLEEQVQSRLGSQAMSIVSGALPLLNTVVGTLAGILVVVFAGMFLAVDPRTYSHGLTLLVPPRYRDDVHDALGKAGHSLRWWMVGTVISMTIIGLLSGFGLWILGVPAAFALGLIAGLLEFIPFFGPVLGLIPAVLVALLASPSKALWVLLLYLGIQQLESNVITPLVMKEAVELPPALTILFASLMGVLFGFLGLFLAVPILAALKVLVRELYVEDALEGKSRA